MIDNSWFPRRRTIGPHYRKLVQRLLMCERAAITDPEIVQLCEEIVKAQKQEITQMKRILARR